MALIGTGGHLPGFQKNENPRCIEKHYLAPALIHLIH